VTEVPAQAIASWEDRSLYELATYQNGRPFRPEETRASDGVPIVKIAELNNGLGSSTGHFDGTVDPKHLIDTGDLIFAWSGSIVVQRWSGGKAVLNQHLFKVTAVDGVDQRYLMHLLQFMVPVFERIVEDQRTTMGHVKVADLKRLRVALPDLPDQIVIADALSAIDDAIDSNDRTIALAQDFIRAGYAALMIEQSWPTVPMFAEERPLARVEFGAPYAGSKFSDSGVGRPMVRIRDLKTFRPETWTTERIEGEVNVEPGDLLVGMDAEFRPVIWLGESAVLNQRCCRLSPVGVVPMSFLLEALRQPLAYFERAKTGTTVSHLNKADIITFKAPSVPDERLRAFGEVYDRAIELQVHLAAETAHLKEALVLLRRELITGRIRLPLAGGEGVAA